jgi:hypothetical protein
MHHVPNSHKFINDMQYPLSVWFSNLSHFILVRPSITGCANNYWDVLVNHLGTGKREPPTKLAPRVKQESSMNSPKANPKCIRNRFPSNEIRESKSVCEWIHVGEWVKHKHILTALLTNSDVTSSPFLHQNRKQLCYRFLLSAGAAIKSKFMLNSEQNIS